MIPFFIRSQTITMGFFFYTDTLYTHIYMRISYAIKVSAEKNPYALYIKYIYTNSCEYMLY